MEIWRGDWQTLGAVLTPGLRHWPGTSEAQNCNRCIFGGSFRTPVHVKKQNEDGQSVDSVLTQGPRRWKATSRLTSWRMTSEHWRPACAAALTNDLMAPKIKCLPFGVWNNLFALLTCNTKEGKSLSIRTDRHGSRGRGQKIYTRPFIFVRLQ